MGLKIFLQKKLLNLSEHLASKGAVSKFTIGQMQETRKQIEEAEIRNNLKISNP